MGQKSKMPLSKLVKMKKVIKSFSDIYSHEGYVVSQDSNFDIVREYAEQVGQ